MTAALTIGNEVPYHIVVDFATFGQCGAVGYSANAENISCFVCAVIIETRIRRADLIDCQSSARYYDVGPGTNAVEIRTVLFVILITQSLVPTRPLHPNLLKRRRLRDLLSACAKKLTIRVLSDITVGRAEPRPSVFQCEWTRRTRGYIGNSVKTFILVLSVIIVS